MKLIGSGDNLLNLVNARDVARGIVLAADSPQAAGRRITCAVPAKLSQREFFDLLSERLDLPPRQPPRALQLAWTAASLLEFLFRLGGSKSPPPFTRRALLC